MILEYELGLILLGERDLGALDCLMQLVAQIGFYQVRQSGNFFGLEGPNARRTKHLADCASTQKGKMMPMLKSHIDPAWDGDKGLVAGLFKRACSEMR